MEPEAKSQSDVPGQVFEEFLRELTSKNVPASVVDSLKTTISEEDFTESAVKKALFGENSV